MVRISVETVLHLVHRLVAKCGEKPHRNSNHVLYDCKAQEVLQDGRGVREGVREGGREEVVSTRTGRFFFLSGFLLPERGRKRSFCGGSLSFESWMREEGASLGLAERVLDRVFSFVSSAGEEEEDRGKEVASRTCLKANGDSVWSMCRYCRHMRSGGMLSLCCVGNCTQESHPIGSDVHE